MWRKWVYQDLSSLYGELHCNSSSLILDPEGENRIADSRETSISDLQIAEQKREMYSRCQNSEEYSEMYTSFYQIRMVVSLISLVTSHAKLGDEIPEGHASSRWTEPWGQKR